MPRINSRIPLDEISEGAGEIGYVDSWLTMQSIISAIWRDFKFQPFKEKLKSICTSVGFTFPDDVRNLIVKHVEIRNSFQHHEGQFTKEMARQIGQNSLEILTEESMVEKLKMWDRIYLTIPEIVRFADAIISFAKGYESHIEERMKTRQTMYVKNNSGLTV